MREYLSSFSRGIRAKLMPFLKDFVDTMSTRITELDNTQQTVFTKRVGQINKHSL